MLGKTCPNCPRRLAARLRRAMLSDVFLKNKNETSDFLLYNSVPTQHPLLERSSLYGKRTEKK